MRDEQFEQLRAKATAGSTDALEFLVEHHSEALAHVIRRRLHQRLRSQFDTLDFQQIVWQSMLENLDRLGECRDQNDVRIFLFQIAKGRVIDAFRKVVGRQHKTVELEIRDPGDSNWERPDAYATDPTPSKVVRDRDECERLVDQMPPKYRRSLEMIKSGHNISEVANELGVNERTIRRLFSKLASKERQ